MNKAVLPAKLTASCACRGAGRTGAFPCPWASPKRLRIAPAELIDWSVFETRWAALFPSRTGRPASSPRLIAGLLYLQHTFACSDEDLVWTWVENPYWQHFCGETYFQHEPPIDPSSMTRWRQRTGEEGVEWLLTETIEAACRGKVVKAWVVQQIGRGRRQ